MKKKILFLSDFTIDNLANIFISDVASNEFQLLNSPPGNLINNHIDIKNPYFDDLYFCFIWCLPESVIPEISNNLEKSKISEEYLNKCVDIFSEKLKKISEKTGFLFVAKWTYNTTNHEIDFLSMKKRGLSNLLIKMNMRLIDNLQEIDNIFILDTDRWLKIVGKGSYSSRSWYKAKIPFSNDVFIEASKDISSTISASQGVNKKLLILDLDNTIWGGVVGEDGIDNLDLGGHSAIGEAFVDFQKSILNLKQRGVLLAINSKNNAKDALDMIDNHPEMILKNEDFIATRINWKNKEENIISIVKELNLGLESVVFIDDSAIERNRVINALPEVFVPEFPKSPFELSVFLNSMTCFDHLSLTSEDSERHKMYNEEKARSLAKLSIKNDDEWFATLGIKVESKKLDKSNLKRCAQLLNKTNQMNLSTRRMIETDLLNWNSSNENQVFTINVFDKFGSYGLTGILSTTKSENEIEIVDFVLSCRALGRKVEEAMIYIASEYALSLGCNKIKLEFKKTKKNMPCFEFLKTNKIISEISPNIFIIDPDKCLRPQNINITQL